MTTTAAASTRVSGRTLNLVLATWTFAITFWAWNLVGPLAARYTEELGLSATEKSLLVATPVLVGAVGRIPVGALTDRVGGRRRAAPSSRTRRAPAAGSPPDRSTTGRGSDSDRARSRSRTRCRR